MIWLLQAIGIPLFGLSMYWWGKETGWKQGRQEGWQRGWDRGYGHGKDEGLMIASEHRLDDNPLDH